MNIFFGWREVFHNFHRLGHSEASNHQMDLVCWVICCKMCVLFEALHFRYRAILFKWEFIIQMRDAVSQPSLDIEESYFSKNILFFFKNDFLFYDLKLYIPSVPLIWVFEAFYGPPFCSLTKGKEEKGGSSKVGSRGKIGSVCLAAALIWMINSHLNRTAL